MELKLSTVAYVTKKWSLKTTQFTFSEHGGVVNEPR